MISPQSAELVRLLLAREIDAALALVDQPTTNSVEKTISHFVKAVIIAYRGDAVSAARLVKQAMATEPGIRDHQVRPSILRRQGEKKQAVLWEAQLIEYVHHLNTDVFLISYPKCGRTWLRYMLGLCLLGEQDGDPMNVYDLSAAKHDLTTVYVNHDDFPFNTILELCLENPADNFLNVERFVINWNDYRDFHGLD